MSKHDLKTILVNLLFIVFAISSYAGNANKALKDQAVDKIIVTDEMEAQMEAKIRANFDEYNAELSRHQANVAKGTLADGDTIGFTVRDFTMNTCMGRKIAIDPATGNLHAIFTQWQPATAPYHEFYNFFDPNFNLWLGDAAIDPALDNLNTRSGRVLNGPNGEAWVFFHNHEAAPAHRGYLYIDNGPGFYSFTQHEIAEGRFASGDYKDGGMTVFATNDQDGNFEVDRFFASTDGGASWIQTSGFLTWPAGDVIANVELYPHFNPANGEISMMYANDNPSDLGEAAWWATSNDLGDNWNITQIYQEETVLPDSVWYLIENFCQYFTETDENGVTHFVFNGYGYKLSDLHPDSLLYFIFPVAYWNTSMASFDDRIELTDDIIGRNPDLQDEFTNFPGGTSGNNLGNAFPSVALGPPGSGIVAALWEQKELAPGDTTLVIATLPDGSIDPANPTVYATDIWAAVSADGGQTWSPSFKVDGQPAKSERSPSMARLVEEDTNGDYWIHYVYMYDPDPGEDFPNDPSLPAAWVYGKYNITPHIITGIDHVAGNVATNFKLAQNYPNPFNPSTTISFNVQKRVKVTLDVYNTLGQKVRTLFNGMANPGEHDVELSGDALNSGIYFYQLTVDNFKRTKKMVLMK